jgi:hypothetical protein
LLGGRRESRHHRSCDFCLGIHGFR